MGAPSIPRIGDSPEIVAAAVAHEGIGKGPPTAFQVYDNWIAFRVTEEQLPDPTGFESARDEILSNQLRRKRYERVQAWRDSGMRIVGTTRSAQSVSASRDMSSNQVTRSLSSVIGP